MKGDEIKLMRCFLCFLVLAVFMCWVAAREARAAWGLTGETVVEGCVLVGEVSSSSGPDNVVLERSPVALYGIVDAGVPLSGVEIREGDGEGTVLTGGDGFFSLPVKRWFFQSKSITLEIVTPLKSFNVDVELDESPFVAVVVNREGGGLVYTKKPDESPGVPVALVSMSVFPAFTAGKGGVWSRTAELLEADRLPSRPECHRIDCGDAGDFMNVPALLHRRLSALSRIYGGAGVRCAGFGAGAVALRHYSVSSVYRSGTIECILQVAPPNKGMTLAAPLAAALGERHGRLLSQLSPDSPFIENLNKGTGAAPEAVERFFLAPANMNEAGFNPRIRTFIIAGEVMEEGREALKSAAGRFGRSAGALIDAWKDFISGHGLDSGFLEQLEGAGRELLEHYQKGLENLPAGDLVVPLDRALVDGVEYRILPHGHFSLLEAESTEDERYRAVRDFLMGEGVS